MCGLLLLPRSRPRGSRPAGTQETPRETLRAKAVRPERKRSVRGSCHTADQLRGELGGTTRRRCLGVRMVVGAGLVGSHNRCLAPAAPQRARLGTPTSRCLGDSCHDLVSEVIAGTESTLCTWNTPDVVWVLVALVVPKDRAACFRIIDPTLWELLVARALGSGDRVERHPLRSERHATNDHQVCTSLLSEPFELIGNVSAHRCRRHTTIRALFISR